MMKIPCCLEATILSAFLFAPPISADEQAGIFDEAFDRDPGWIGFRNRLLPRGLPDVKQSFGYRRSNRAFGQKSGEIGGLVHRAHLRAYYARPIQQLTLEQRFSASGKLSVLNARGNSGVLIGWFNHEKSYGWRTPNSLALRVDGNDGKYWVFCEYGTARGRTGGVGAFEGERYQTTPTKPFGADGRPHTWSITYDPDGAGGRGIIELSIDSRRYELPLRTGHKMDGAIFDRFGIWNQQVAGNSLEVYFDDLFINNDEETFDVDPNWKEKDNSLRYQPRVVRPYHDFGFSSTSHAGGNLGEIGGIVFRDERPMYYADEVGPFDLDSRLHASGKIVLSSAGADSAVNFGWFGVSQKENKRKPEHEAAQTDWLGIMIEGPSRVGHYFRAAYSTKTGERHAPTGEGTRVERPVIRPSTTTHDWSITYDPRGANNRGRITVALDQTTHHLDLKPNHRRDGATFDRFGVFNTQTGGHHVEVYLDNIKYSKAQ